MGETEGDAPTRELLATDTRREGLGMDIDLGRLSGERLLELDGRAGLGRVREGRDWILTGGAGRNLLDGGGEGS